MAFRQYYTRMYESEHNTSRTSESKWREENQVHEDLVGAFLLKKEKCIESKGVL